MATHQLAPAADTVHGAFNPELAPVLTIDPGDTVIFRTPVSGWWEEPPTPAGGERSRLAPAEGIPTNGHCLVGPVAIRGAEPGMTLVVRIGQIDPASWGETYSGGTNAHQNRWFGLTQPGDRISAAWSMQWDAQRQTGMGSVDFGFQVPLRPFFGVIGMPPAEAGWHPTSPPRLTGGNIDCKDLINGTTLYLPIHVSGGLVSVGDGHGTQTDGEVSGTAIECPIDRGELTFDLLPDQPLASPWAETHEGLVTFGFDTDLNAASMKALQAMTDMLRHRYDLSVQQALILGSVAIDLRITQVVNGVQGVHAVLANDVLTTI